MSRRISVVLTTALLVGSLSLVMMFVPMGCNAPQRISGTLISTPERDRRLMALAAEEAAQIRDVDARLTRQLNLAERQIRKQWLDEARATLAAARRTLASDDAGKLNTHARISGWVAVSELSREVADKQGAVSAIDAAVKEIDAIDDPAKRCDYVMGVANELQYLKGRDAAVRMLTDAAPWTRAIDDLVRRRQATVSFASALFNLDDFEGGRTMLQQDDDAAWRTDTLVMLASLGESRRTAEDFMPSRARAGAEAAELQAIPAGEPYFGKQLGYRKVFQGQQKSQTQED